MKYRCLFLACCIFLAVNRNYPETSDLSFIGVKGTTFTNAESSDFRFTGINLDPWRFIVGKGEIYSRADFISWLDAGKELCGMKAVRMHMNGGAFEPSTGTYSEAAFVQLDALLDAAASRRMYVIVALRDYLWGPWPSDAYDPYWYMGGASSPKKDAIFRNASAKAAFKNFIAFVLNRTNSLNGKIYKDDPAVLAWEIINEPNIISGVTRSWLTEMGGYIRSIDSKHLLTVGIAGAEASWWRSGSANWAELNISQIDFIDLHYYADARFYNPVSSGNAAEIRDRVKACLALGKPVVFGEFGCLNTNPDETIINLNSTVLSNCFAAGGSGGFPYSWGPPGPNGWGGKGSFCIFTNRQAVCEGLKNWAQ